MRSFKAITIVYLVAHVSACAWFGAAVVDAGPELFSTSQWRADVAYDGGDIVQTAKRFYSALVTSLDVPPVIGGSAQWVEVRDAMSRHLVFLFCCFVVVEVANLDVPPVIGGSAQ
jgi:hypothetical protein